MLKWQRHRSVLIFLKKSLTDSFTALCTIGFGDMVPMKSQDLNSGIQTLEYVVRGIYITLGLCLMSSLICAAVSAVRMVDRNRCE